MKPDNILLVGDEFKLADFGFSGFREKENSNGNLLEMRKRHGTDSYGTGLESSSHPESMTYNFT